MIKLRKTVFAACILGLAHAEHALGQGCVSTSTGEDLCAIASAISKAFGKGGPKKLTAGPAAGFEAISVVSSDREVIVTFQNSRTFDAIVEDYQSRNLAIATYQLQLSENFQRSTCDPRFALAEFIAAGGILTEVYTSSDGKALVVASTLQCKVEE